MRRHFKDRWDTRWRTYQELTPAAQRTPVQCTGITSEPLKLRTHLHKAEISLATHIRTECISLAAYLHSRRVPGFDSPRCPCGPFNQTAKHVLIYCAQHARGRHKLFEEAGTNDYRILTTTGRGLKAATRFLMCTGILSQFQLASCLLYGELTMGEQ